MKQKISGKQQVRVPLTMKETGLLQKKKRNAGQYKFYRDIIKDLVQTALRDFDAEYASTGKLMLSFRYRMEPEEEYTRIYGILPEDDFGRVVFYSKLTGLSVQKIIRYIVLPWIYGE